MGLFFPDRTKFMNFHSLNNKFPDVLSNCRTVELSNRRTVDCGLWTVGGRLWTVELWIVELDTSPWKKSIPISNSKMECRLFFYWRQPLK